MKNSRETRLSQLSLLSSDSADSEAAVTEERFKLDSQATLVNTHPTMIPGSYANLTQAPSKDVLMLSRRFNGEIFTIKVGDMNPHTFTAHKEILAQSPVLMAMCSDRFMEGAAKTIKLPDDNVEAIGRMLEFLYGHGEEAALDFSTTASDSVVAKKLLELYVLADKYQLKNFQTLVIDRFDTLRCIQEDAITFFAITSHFFPDIPASDFEFTRSFTSLARTHLRAMSLQQMERLAEMLEEGGRFATRVFMLMAEVSSDTAAEKDFEKSVVKEERDANRTSLLKATRLHNAYHPHCFSCHILRDDELMYEANGAFGAFDPWEV